ncbi:MAG TPA: stress response translation initiation inhibitor YciH [Chloroflexota bacterium]|jgi:translation initiation factor 1
MNSRLVYDSDAPLQKPPRPPKARAEPPAANLKLPNDGVVRLLRDRKGRGGKTVTLVAGLPLAAAPMAALASDLKRLCGTGGTVRGEVIEIQGDVRERIKGELERRGYTVKLAGG